MVVIDDLAFKTRIDLGGWNQGLHELDSTLESFSRKATEQLDRLPSPKLSAPDTDLGRSTTKEAEESSTDFAAIGSQIERIGIIFGGIGSQIRAGLSESVGPIQQFAARFSAQFDQVGATVEQLSIRIDAAMRFPIFEKRINNLRSTIMAPFRKLPDEVKQALDPVNQIHPPFTGIIDDAAKAGQQVAATWTATAKQIGEYDLLGATHVPPGKQTFKAYLDAIDEFKTDAVLAMEAARDTILSQSGNKGKGSRTAFNKRKANAAQIAQMQANRPDMDLQTAPTSSKNWIGRMAADPGWKRIGDAGKSAADALSSPFTTAARLLRNFAKDAAIDADRFLASWLKASKLKGFFSSLGSVADATFGKLARIKVPTLGLDPRQPGIVKGIGAAAEQASGSFLNLGKSIAAALGFFGLTYKAVGFLKDGVVEVANLNETLSKTDAILGQAAPDVKAFADTMADRFGLVKRETLDLAAGFGGIFKGLGQMRGDELGAATKQFTTLAADLSSFGNVSFDQAGESLRSALTGNESDFLKKLGVDYRDAAIEAYSFSHGINKSSEDMTEQEKVMIRMQLLLQGTADAQGDLEKTADSTANMWRNLTGTLSNFGAEIGASMLPAIDEGLKLLIGGVDNLKAGFESSKAIIGGWITTVGAGFDFVAATVSHPTAALEVLRLYGVQTLANIAEWIMVIPENFMLLYNYIDKNGFKLFNDLAINALTATENIGKNFMALGEAIGKFLSDPMKGFSVNWTPLTEGFLHTADKLPAMIRPVLTDLSKEIGEAGKPIVDDFARRRDEAAAEKPAFSEAKGDALVGANAEKKKKKTKKEDQFAGALEVNSKEAYSAFVSAAYGGSRGHSELEKTGREQLAANRKGNAILGQIAKAVSGAPQQISFP